jgi:ABC-type ATPase involved in cell division
MPAALLVHRLGKSFEAGFRDCRAKVVALRDIELDVSFGELASVVGPRGSGKTTLLRIIGGLLEPTAGSVFRSARVVFGSSWVDIRHDDEPDGPPAIFVCDDAFDDRPAADLERFFESLRRAGHAVLISDRSAEEPRRCGARILPMEGGRLIEPRFPKVLALRRSRIAEGVNRRRGY